MSFKLEFKFPKNQDFLIFDSLKVDILGKYLGKSFNVIFFRNNRFNIYALLYALVFFFKSEFKIEYINFFLKFTKKKTIISFNYNRIILYKIKKYYPSTKIIIIQNGLSNKFFIQKLKRSNFQPSCDYFLCMTNVEKKIFRKYIDANFLVIGSFLNNFFSVKNKKINEILIISQFRDKNSILDFQENYFLTIKFLTPILVKFSKYYKIPISILGSSKNFQKEKLYYKNLFEDYKFNFYRRSNYMSYKRIDMSSIIIGVDSTLVYEAFARGKKIFIFNLSKMKKKFFIHDSFLLKYFLKLNGFFWVKTKSRNKILNLLKNIYLMKQKDWMEKKKIYNNLFILDSQNKIFKNIISKKTKLLK